MSQARLAGFATRTLALLIDCVILDVAVVALGAGLAWVATVIGIDVNASTPLAVALAGTGWLVLLSTYLTAFWWLAGQTPGMRFMGIRVTDRQGTAPGFVRSLRRLAGFYLSIVTFGAGFLLVLVDDRRRGLHDRLAGTLVVHTPRRRRSGSVLDHLDRMMPEASNNGSISEPRTPTEEDRDHAAHA
jgi:uncharacterized RDD family membrane protein YckC